MWRAALWIIVVAFLCGWLAEREADHGLLHEPEQFLHDWVAGNAGAEPVRSQVTLIEVLPGAEGFFEAGHWSPLGYALILQAVAPLQPAVLGVVPAPGGEDRAWAEFEPIIRNQALQIGRLIWGVELGRLYEPDLPMPPLGIVRAVRGNTDLLFEFRGVERAPPETLLLAGQPGVINLPRRTSKPVLQRSPLIYRRGGDVVAGLPLQMWIAAQGLTLEDVLFDSNRGLFVGEDHFIPLDRSGCLRLDGRAFTGFERVRFDDVMVAGQSLAEDLLGYRPGERIAQRMVLAGEAGEAAPTYRLPDGSEVTKAEIFAAMTALLDAGTVPHRGEAQLRVLILAAWALVLAVLALVRPAHRKLAVFFLVLVYLMTAVGVYRDTQLLLPVLAPLLMVVVAWLAVALYPQKPSSSGTSAL